MLCARLTAWLDAGKAAALVTVTGVQGSAPREVGAMMGVSREAIYGTIGGGALEAEAICAARSMLVCGGKFLEIDQPLGPEIGQCCGGRVQMRIVRLDRKALAALQDTEAAKNDARPHAIIFGAGHTGSALASALSSLPFDVTVVDERAEWLGQLGSTVKPVHTALPEAEVAAARPGSAIVIMTHDHALDFLIAEAALTRADMAYVGMIGSATKRAKLTAELDRKGVSSANLVCPLGAAGPKDKRPEVIAIATAAEIAAALL